MHMFLNKKNKKKEKLWSASSTVHQTYTQNTSIMLSVQPQQHHHQHQHHRQDYGNYRDISRPKYDQLTQCSGSWPSKNWTISCGEYQNEMRSSSEKMSIEQDTSTSGQYESNLTDYSEDNDYYPPQNWPQGTQVTEEFIINGQQSSLIQNNNRPNSMEQHQHVRNQNYFLNQTTLSAVSATTNALRRYCCAGGSQSSESSIGTYSYPQNCSHTISTFTSNNININNNNNAIGINHNNNNNNMKNNYNFSEQISTTLKNHEESRQALFNDLVKSLKSSQLDTLLQVVVDKRRDSDCVLAKGEDLYVNACYLFLWPDLRTSAELKRVPMCPSVNEKVYVCCNPAHWHRILNAENIPPPYRETEMDGRKPEDRAPSENLKDADICTVSGSTFSSRVQIPESFTTNGEDYSSPPQNWCEILYFELKTRIGPKYYAKNSTVNIYSEGSGGMCLKDSFSKTMESSVEKIRQRIGLGITLSQEADGVWLYNRSEADIFIHSPTLNADFRDVTKVPPGYCLNAFDNNRARTQKLVYPPSIAGAQSGPIDIFSMKISFAKGWGTKYRRQDITGCPCWLEIIFQPR